MSNQVNLKPFCLVGISIRTKNAANQAAKDLGELWQKFYSESIPEKVEESISDEVFSVYTEYESDYRGEYTAFIGLKVASLENIPHGLKGLEIKGGAFLEMNITGDPAQSIPLAWVDIWAREDSLDRRYTADFEVYGAQSQQGKDSIVKIFLAVR